MDHGVGLKCKPQYHKKKKKKKDSISLLLEWLSSRTDIGKDVGEEELHSLLVGM
jgi:hypothetical protein